jgi:anti-sigma-K factor RskA
MSDDLNGLTPRDEQDLQAAEYVMGLLPANQARALEALALNDATVAASITAWELRLAPLAGVVTPVQPPPVLWHRLALAVGIDNVIQADFGAQRPLRRGAGVWKGMTVGSLALAAGMAYLLLVKPPLPAGQEPLVAALSPYGSPGATFLVRVGPNGAATVVAVGDTNVPQGRSLELWAVNGNAAPVSMGLLPDSGRKPLTISAQSGTQLLVSQEPEGGSPTKAPTGPVVYAGKLTGI